MTRVDKFEGENAYWEALRMARYGRKAWVSYRTKGGQRVAERLTVDSIKRCLVAVGTKGHWTLIETDGSSTKGFWWLGCNLLAQLKRGGLKR